MKAYGEMEVILLEESRQLDAPGKEPRMAVWVGSRTALNDPVATRYPNLVCVCPSVEPLAIPT
jgi:hypothetical protein